MWQRIKNKYHLLIAALANHWFDFPSKNLTVIGVTGTDGKTTTVSLIYHILKTAGKKVAMFSSVGASIGGKVYDVGFHVTTPSPFKLQRYIKKAAHTFARGPANEGALVAHKNFLVPSAKNTQSTHKLLVANSDSENFVGLPRTGYLILEVTSHALDQNRVAGIKFDIGVLTNVSHEHLDYHKTYENYVRTKAKLLQMAKVTIVNRDDESFQIISKLKTQISKLQRKTQSWITFGLGSTADVNPQVFPFKTNLIGKFNKYNVLAAIAACRQLGIGDKDIRKGVSTFTPPVGRQELVHPSTGSGQADFQVMIDFAHTPNAFEELLPEVRKETRGRLIHIFGAAGERDASKRPLMGRVASKYDDIIVLTAEDPRSESVEQISNEISKGILNFQFLIFNEFSKANFQFKKGKKYLFKIPDRKKAIGFAISLAKKGDLVLLTGKSHEKSMNYGRGEEPWDEFEEVIKAIKSIESRFNLERMKGEEYET